MTYDKKTRELFNNKNPGDDAKPLPTLRSTLR